MKAFIKDTIERAIKTAAQTAVAAIGTSTVIGTVDWRLVASTATLATILSVLTSIASKPIGNNDSASIVNKGDE